MKINRLLELYNYPLKPQDGYREGAGQSFRGFDQNHLSGSGCSVHGRRSGIHQQGKWRWDLAFGGLLPEQDASVRAGE